VTLSITMLRHYAECHYGECRVSFSLMLNVIMLSVIMLSVVAPLRAIPGTLTDWGRLSTVDFVIKVVRFMKLVNYIFNI